MTGYAGKRTPASKYTQASSSEANYATPHRLVQMLMEGALDKIAIAKGAIERKEIQIRHDNITWAISIIDALRSSLDAEKGGEIAVNLEALYLYMGKRLVEGGATNDIRALDEVASLLNEIKQAWDVMPDYIRHAPNIDEAVSGGEK
ncbi:MAG: flagellar export chaperone FliS [Candidatus Sedimenticola sp. (ex Thyasira tokunagai)]